MENIHKDWYTWTVLNTWLTISSVRLEREVLREHFEYALAWHDMKIDKGILIAREYQELKYIPDLQFWRSQI